MKLKLNIALCNSFILLGFFITSCQRHQNEVTIPEVIRISPDSAVSVKRSNLFELDRIIWLEAVPEMQIGDREGLALLRANDKIVVSSSSIGVFSKDGNFIHNIGKRGRGPGEYLNNFAVTVGKSQDILRVLDRSGQKVLDYDLKGKYLGHFNLGVYPNNFTYSGSYTLVYMGYEPNETNKRLLLYDKGMNLVDGFFEMDSDRTRYMNAFSISNFFHYKDSLRFMNPFEYTIWDLFIKDDKLHGSPRFKIDFGEHNITEDFYNQYFPSVFEFYQKLTEKGFAHSIWMYWETEYNVFFVFSFRNKQLLGIYCKNTRKSIAVDQINDDILFQGLSLHATQYEALYYYPMEDQIYFVVEAWKFRELMKQTRKRMNEDEWLKYAKELPSMVKIFEKITDSDNPVIFVFNIKNVII
jgi:hypothetical protein